MQRVPPFSAWIVITVTLVTIIGIWQPWASAESADNDDAKRLSLITDTPEEGFEVALALARRGVTETQPDTDVLHELRGQYANDPESLIAASHVVAVHFRTVAEANNYWRQ